MRAASLVVASLAFTALSATARQAHAVPIAVEPNGYPGQWATLGAWHSGAETLDFPPGVHAIYVGAHGGFNITVAADGNVTTDSAAADTGPGRVAFRSTPVAIEPGAYAGSYAVERSVDWTGGARTVVLVRGLRYVIAAGAYNGWFFDVDAAGDVTSLDAAKATGSGATLTFRTAPLAVDPGAYAGLWAVERSVDWTTGPRTVHLVPAGRYVVAAGAYNGWFFDLDAAGNATSLDSAKATASGGALTFHTVPVAVDPGAYTGTWALDRAADWGAGPRTLALVPAGRYAIAAGAYNAWLFDVDAAGAVSSLDARKATGAGATLTFVTTWVTFSPGAFTGQWVLERATAGWLTGVHTLALVPAGTYHFYADGVGSQFLEVGAPCAVTPDAWSAGGYTFGAVCGAPDADGDGTPDASDGCPADAGKVAPGVCGCGTPDTDDDGDGLPSCVDACPAQDATGQDADGDGCVDAGLAGLAAQLASDAVPATVRGALSAKVDAAASALARGNVQAARGQLTAFVQQVQALRGKKLPVAIADALVAAAGAVLAGL